MHINFVGGNVGLPLNLGSQELLTQLLSEQGAFLATIKKLTPHSILLKVENGELELPLAQSTKEQRAELAPGSLVRIEMFQEQTLVMTKVPPSKPQSFDPREGFAIPAQLDEALVELNIPATPTTIAVARALLEGGFALQEKLVWALLPWAENGQLEKVLPLLQAKFPLTPELVEVVEEVRHREGEQALLPKIREQLSPEFQESLTRPRWENRAKWSNKPQDREAVQRLVKLLVEERFVESLLNQQAHLGEHVFALPFLLNDDLYTSWVRIAQEQRPAEGSTERGFRIQLAIPTSHFGLVEADLAVWGKNIRLTLWVDGVDPENMAGALPNLEGELIAQGWEPSSLMVLRGPRKGGLGDAESSSLAL